MMSKYKYLVWAAVGFLICIPPLYLLLNISNRTLWEGAIANWFATVMGVIVGVPIALYISNMQHKAMIIAEKERREKDREDNIKLYEERMYFELRDNQVALSQLHVILYKPKNARKDTWIWARHAADAFEFYVRKEFENIILSASERINDGPTALAYLNLRRLQNRVRQAEAAHDFYYGYSANESAANDQLAEVREFMSIVEKNVTNALNQYGERGVPAT